MDPEALAEILKTAPMSAIMKELETNRFSAFVLASVHEGEDEEGNPGEFFECARAGSNSHALGLARQAVLFLEEEILTDNFGPRGVWIEEEEDEEEDLEGPEEEE